MIHSLPGIVSRGVKPVDRPTVAKADIWEVSKVNIYFIAVLFTMLMLVTYVPAVPMTLVNYFYR